MVESVVNYLHEGNMLGWLESWAIHGMTYVFLINIIDEEVSKAILCVSLYVAWHILSKGFMSYIL